MDNSIIRKTFFSTSDLSGVESIKKWREFISEVYCRQDVSMASAERAAGSISMRRIGEITVSHFCAGGAQRLVRNKSHAKLDMIEHFHFVFPSVGTFAFQQGDVEQFGNEGDAFVINASRDFRIDFSEHAETLVVAVPCEIMRSRIIGIDDFIARNTIADPLSIRLIKSIAANIINVDSNISNEAIQEVCLNLIETAILEARNIYRKTVVNDVSNDHKLEIIRACIGERYTEDAFSLKQLSEMCNMSKRHIQNILSANGTSYTDELLNTRLYKAANLLKTKRRSSMTIREIAKLCGFASHAYFSSCYRRRFGASPSDHQEL